MSEVRSRLDDRLSAVHPITGDRLSWSDRVSWWAQSVIRRWTFIVVVVAFSVFWWLNPALFHDPDLAHWNVGASLLAIVIESIVGIGVFSQTTRDAVILRRLDKVQANQAVVLEQLRAVLESASAIEAQDFGLDSDTNRLVHRVAAKLAVDLADELAINQIAPEQDCS